MRRRTFLTAAGLAGTSLALPSSAHASEDGPAATLENRLADVLLRRGTVGEPVGPADLHVELGAAVRDFAACRYDQLAFRLPGLIASVEATSDDRGGSDVHAIAARTYQLATRALIKLDASGLEWISADRAMHAAENTASALTMAESQRLVASVARRAGHHHRAEELTLAAADHLNLDGRAPAEHLAMAGQLYCSAGYAAARAGDRVRASDLLDEAHGAAARLGSTPEQHRVLAANVVSHRVSAASVLGDAEVALRHASSMPVGAIPTVERRARFLVDAAMAYQQWSKPGLAYRTLLRAERCAPGEVRTRGAARRLVGELLSAPRQAGMPGLRSLAARIHATA